MVLLSYEEKLAHSFVISVLLLKLRGNQMRTDLIHDSRHLCTRSKIDGIKVKINIT